MSGTPTPTTGSVTDIVGRLKAVLPSQWFPVPTAESASPTPILDGVLTGLAWAWSQLYSLVQYVQLQTRIATATGANLDMIAADFFGLALTREVNEGDTAFSARIRASIIQPKATRPAVIQVLENLTGQTPKVFEPANTGDTGGYGTDDAPTWSGVAYSNAGGWGSLQLPYQAFIIAYRPTGGGIAGAMGYYTADTYPVITPGSGSLTDASGNVYTITTAGVVEMNGSPLGSTSGVIAGAYVNGSFWQENSSYLWWKYTGNPSAPWTGGSTSASPIIAAAGWAGGGYGVGGIEYADTSMIEGEVTDAAIYATIAQTIPAGTIAWTQISNP
jgi:hypothetical protein